MLPFNTNRMIAVMLTYFPWSTMRDVRSKGGATANVSARAGVVRREASCAALWTIHNGASPEGAVVGVHRSCNEAVARERKLDAEIRSEVTKQKKAPVALGNGSSSVLLTQSSDVPATGAKAGRSIDRRSLAGSQLFLFSRVIQFSLHARARAHLGNNGVTTTRRPQFSGPPGPLWPSNLSPPPRLTGCLPNLVSLVMVKLIGTLQLFPTQS